jgi:hypothetical protein
MRKAISLPVTAAGTAVICVVQTAMLTLGDPIKIEFCTGFERIQPGRTALREG